MSYKINYSAEEKIKLAKDDSAEKLYDSKKNQRTVRVLTVCAYMLTVSMAAIILSLYYVFLWNPKDLPKIKNVQAAPNEKCDLVIIPENIAIQLANGSGQVSFESFYDDILNQIEKMQQDYRSSKPKGQQKVTRKEFNKFLKSKLIHDQSDIPPKKILKRTSNKKKIQDDEDFNMDTESSGDKVVTTMFPTHAPESTADLNDTTIIFDQEQDD